MDIFVGDGKIKCDYCFGIGACPRCWGRAAIEKINHHLDILYVEKEQTQLCIENLKLQLTKLEKENFISERNMDHNALLAVERLLTYMPDGNVAKGVQLVLDEREVLVKQVIRLQDLLQTIALQLHIRQDHPRGLPEDCVEASCMAVRSVLLYK